jgi:hypothetical protein
MSLPVVTGSAGSGYSVSIVNSDNGKRLTVSKALTKELSLDKEIYVAINAEDKEFYISNAPIINRSSHCKVSGTDKKICYSAALVTLIVDSFNLNYSGKTSMSFNNISFEEVDDIVVAIVAVEDDKCLAESSQEV